MRSAILVLWKGNIAEQLNNRESSLTGVMEECWSWKAKEAWSAAVMQTMDIRSSLVGIPVLFDNKDDKIG